MVDVRHVRGRGDLRDRVTRLLLGADEQHGPAPAAEVRRKPARVLQQRLRLQEVDDVDAVPFTEDESAHLGVPTARLVAKVHSGLQQLLDSDLSHGLLPYM